MKATYDVIKKCPVCGDLFYEPLPDLWAYRVYFLGKPKDYCSWHCLRADESRLEEEKRKRRMQVKRNLSEVYYQVDPERVEVNRKRLREELEKADISPYRLSKYLGRSDNYINDILRGRSRSLSKKDFAKVCRALGCKWERLEEKKK